MKITLPRELGVTIALLCLAALLGSWLACPDLSCLAETKAGRVTVFAVAALAAIVAGVYLLEGGDGPVVPVLQRTAGAYRQALHDALGDASDGDLEFWNELFVAGLDRRGLMLALQRPAGDLGLWYPYGAPLQGPPPVEAGPDVYRWAPEALVVWKPARDQ